MIYLKRSKNYDKLLKQMDKPIAFVLGKYTSTGLGVSRCLGKQGIPVLWLDSNSKQAGFFSKYCTGIVCPHSKNKEKKYIDFLLTIGEKLSHKGMLFPIADIEVSAILKNRSKLEQYYHIPMADFNATEILLNKKKFYQILEKQGISHPKTYFPHNISELDSMSNEVRYPCMAKPAHSEPFRFIFNTKFFRAESRQELIQKYRKAILNNQEVMIQEIIPGDAKHMCGFNAYYDKNFTPNGIFMYRRIREWPPGSGNGIFIENVVIPELEQIISPFIKAINYYGIIDAEFKKDPRNGTFNLLEINPRCWMQVSFPMKCGINLPYIAYMGSLGNDVKKMIPKKEQKKWLFAFLDILSSLRGILNDDFSIREWIHSYKGEKDYAIFSWDDPLPLFLGFIYIIRGLTHY